MIDICPTITADNAHTYREQVERVVPFAERIHIDFADGELAPTKLLEPIQAWIPSETICDLHVMYQKPEKEIETLISHLPHMIILHAEADGNILGMLREIKATGIKAGLALLQNTQPEDYANEIESVDHVLVFGGKLGYHGGQADLTQLQKIDRIRAINATVEIGWDGGANTENVEELVRNMVEVINVGSAIQKADSPDSAYATISAKANGEYS